MTARIAKKRADFKKVCSTEAEQHQRRIACVAKKAGNNELNCVQPCGAEQHQRRIARIAKKRAIKAERSSINVG